MTLKNDIVRSYIIFYLKSFSISKLFGILYSFFTEFTGLTTTEEYSHLNNWRTEQTELTELNSQLKKDLN